MVEVNTVDRYQGRDKDCIILSYVRSNPNKNVSITNGVYFVKIRIYTHTKLSSCFKTIPRKGGSL